MSRFKFTQTFLALVLEKFREFLVNVNFARKLFVLALWGFCLIVIAPFFANYSPGFEGYLANVGFIIFAIVAVWLAFIAYRPIFGGKDYETFTDLFLEFMRPQIKIFYPHKLNPDKPGVRLGIFILLVIFIIPLSQIYLQQGGFLTPWEILIHFNLPFLWSLAILMKVWI